MHATFSVLPALQCDTACGDLLSLEGVLRSWGVATMETAPVYQQVSFYVTTKKHPLIQIRF